MTSATAGETRAATTVIVAAVAAMPMTASRDTFASGEPSNITGRRASAGMFHSADGGDHWRIVPLEPMNPKGQIYCRDIREVPGNPRKLWVAAGGGFQSDVGVLLKSSDGGDSWTRVDMGLQPPHTMFALAFDERRPAHMSCATNGGEVYSSRDGGEADGPWRHAASSSGAFRLSTHPFRFSLLSDFLLFLFTQSP